MTRLQAFAERVADLVIEAWDPSADDMGPPRAVLEREVRAFMLDFEEHATCGTRADVPD